MTRPDWRDRVTTAIRGSASMLSLQLFVWLFAVIIISFAVYAIFNIRSTAHHWEQNVIHGAQRTSDIIQRSTHYSMLKNHKDAVYQIIRTVAEAPGVERVRIFDKSGTIVFSAAENEIGTKVNLTAEACISCHRSTVPVEVVPEGQRVRIYRRQDGHQVLGLTSPIENAPECSQAACHAHSADQKILGVLDVQMSMAESTARLTTSKRQVVLAAVLTALGAGLFSALFIVRVVRHPVAELISGVREVAGGKLDTEILVTSDNEIGQLAEAFNGMTRDLCLAQTELEEWSSRLESSLQEKTDELGQTQRQVVHMEKMASLGKLAATVAHELNNPLAGILNYSKLVDRTLRESDTTLPEQEELQRYLSLISKEAGRCGSIVRNLLSFARRSGGDFAEHHLNPIIERALMLVRHHLEMSNISLVTEPLSNDDRIVCDGDQLQQALLALAVNAVEAMPDGGQLRVTAEGWNDRVEIRISDTGNGISPDALPHIFEPFFSSKEQSEGAGLGLAVVYGIIHRHHGTIEVTTQNGSCGEDRERGTTFTMVLPRYQGPEEDGDGPAWSPRSGSEAGNGVGGKGRKT